MAVAVHEEQEPQKVRFQDDDHVWWTAYEIRDPNSPSGTSLIFVSGEGFRRVRSYPDDWRGLTPPELAALSWKR